MKVLMVGATGLLGLQGAKELIRRGHTVTGVALPSIPKGLKIPEKLRLVTGNYLEMSDDELLKHFKGCEGFVFAAGIDERVEGAPPIYDLYKKYNIDALKRLMDLAKKTGVKKTVILGSYFSYFAKEWPELELTKHHPYIRSRIDQEEMAFEYASEGMDVAVLELPYIFGAQKGRKPVWLFIAEMIRDTKGSKMYYPKGGTTMVTVRQVGECIAGALERTSGAKAYPVGWYNMTWKAWLEIFSKDMGMPKRVVTIPTFIFKIAARTMADDIANKGLESGLEMKEFVKLMTSEAFIDKGVIKNELGVEPDDIKKAIAESVEVCMDILNDPDGETVEMKAE